MSGSTSNPWTTQQGDVPALSSPPDAAAPEVPVTGPSAPQPGVPAVDAVDRLPRHATSTRATLWWIGAHGGAGESSLSQLLPGSHPASHAWPLVPGAAHDPARAVLVARTSVVGLRAAQRAMQDWASGAVNDVQLLGLVLVADAPGRLPRPLRDLAAVAAGGAPRSWRLPWIEAWRTTDTPDPNSLPHEVRRLLTDLKTLLPTRLSERTERNP
ncbi:MAG: DUF6668 family protein [Angustibacter sp.]